MNDQNNGDRIDFEALGEKAIEAALVSTKVREAMQPRMQTAMRKHLQHQRRYYETQAINSSDEDLIGLMAQTCENLVQNIKDGKAQLPPDSSE